MTALKRKESVMDSNDGNDRDNERKRLSGFWTNSLFNAMEDKSMVVSKDQSLTVIRDKYPKSRHHYLVLLNEDRTLDNLRQLNRTHIQLINSMQIKGKEIAKKVDINSEFRFGFHLIPSLRPLHLHVISQDFDSKSLKTKKHYNSFTTEFFIDSQTVVENLKEFGRIEIDIKKLESIVKQDLVCHFCKIKIKNIHKLKSHLLTHYPKGNN